MQIITQNTQGRYNVHTFKDLKDAFECCQEWDDTARGQDVKIFLVDDAFDTETDTLQRGELVVPPTCTRKVWIYKNGKKMSRYFMPHVRRENEDIKKYEKRMGKEMGVERILFSFTVLIYHATVISR